MELERQDQLCAAYREKLLSFINNIEEQTEELSTKIQRIIENIRRAESEMQKCSQNTKPWCLTRVYQWVNIVYNFTTDITLLHTRISSLFFPFPFAGKEKEICSTKKVAGTCWVVRGRTIAVIETIRHQLIQKEWSNGNLFIIGSFKLVRNSNFSSVTVYCCRWQPPAFQVSYQSEVQLNFFLGRGAFSF